MRLNEGAREGMERSARNAGAAWAERARHYLEKYLETPKGERSFVAPWVRQWAREQGLDEPPHQRAWGGVFHRARADGLIEFAGFTEYADAEMHSQPVRVWRRTGAR